MATFALSDRSIELPAVMQPRAPTRDLGAWAHGEYVTLKLTELIQAVRTHTGGKAFRGRQASRLEGAWYALGNLIQTSSEYTASRALPGAFTRVAWVNLSANTVLNVGLCSPLFGQPGGEAQAEYVGGPPANFIPVNNIWHSKGGRA